MTAELNIQQQQAIALAQARKRKAQSTADVPQEPVNPILRTVGRAGRDVIGAMGSGLDMATLVPKTAILGAGMATGNKSLQDFGTSTNYWHDTALNEVDQLTNNKFAPKTTADKMGDFAAELMTPMGFANGISKTPKAIDALKGVMDLPGLMAGKKASSEAVQRMSADELRKASSSLYQQAKQKGGVLRPEFTNRFLNDIQDIIPQTEAGKLVAGDNAATNLLDRMKALKDRSLTLDEAQEIDEGLGRLVDKHTELGKPTKEGRDILEVQSRLRNFIQDADETQIVGGKGGFDSLKKGRELWSRQARLRDVERIMQHAELTQNPATSIKTGFRTLLTNPNRIKGYSTAERKAIKAAAESGNMQDILHTFGSRLVTVGATVAGGGPAGMVASYAAPAAIRSLAEKMAMNKADKVADLIAGVGQTVPGNAGNATRSFARKAPNALLEDRF